MDDWDDYKYILAVGRQGGLSTAARSLNVNHSTVSRRIAGAEERLGVRLFDRLQSGFIPTEEGLQAIATAERLETELFNLNRQIAARDKNLEGPLRITTPQLIFQSSVSKIVSRFSALYPEIDITVRAANENLDLNKREADVAIRVGNEPDPALFGRRVTRQKRGYFASRSYLETLGDLGSRTPSPASIRFVNFVWWGSKIPKELTAKYPNARTSIKLDDMIAVHSAVRDGMGVGRMPCFLGDTDPALERVPGLGLSPYLDIWVLTHPDLKKIERIRTFMRFTADAFKDNAALYQGDILDRR